MPTGAPFIDTVLLKVASRCNLNCGYCYVYNMGDEGWREQPKLMSATTAERIAEQLARLHRAQGFPFSVVLHGGEPLMLGREHLDGLLRTLSSRLPAECGVHVQTNGVLLDDAMLDLLVAHEVGISVSIDGPASVHDRHRLDHRGRGSHARVRAGIGRILARPDATRLFAGVLAVIDPASDPGEVYADLKSTGAPSLDFLPRDGNWDRLPAGKASSASVEYGTWFSGLLDAYLADPAPPRVRILDDMLRLLMGGRSQKEGVGTTDYGILVFEADGRIDKNDTLKVAHARADRFVETWSVHRHDLLEIVASGEYADYHGQQRPTASQCRACPDLAVCGGGMVAHRWSGQRGFDNPSIFCADQRHLIGRMRAITGAALAA